MVGILEVAIKAAKEAGCSIQIAADNVAALNIEQKSLHDYVTEVDRESERIIRTIIHSHFPEHRILGEEYGQLGLDQDKPQWVVDPLDGTTNFLRKIPHYAVSIGVLDGGKLTHAVVYDPIKDDLFTASSGGGAFLNGEPISVRATPSITGALLSTGVPFSGKNLDDIQSFTDTMTGLLELQTSGLRRLGAAALDLAYVAAGRYDGFWEANLQVWDIAAGALLVKEAGGVVTDLHGQEQYLHSGHILAAAPAVHGDMLVITSKNYRF